MDEADVAWYGEVWSGFRPYLVRMSVDLLVSCLLWISLFVFKSLTQLLTIGSWAAHFIENAHSVGALISFSLFSVLFAVDLYALHRGGKQ